MGKYALLGTQDKGVEGGSKEVPGEAGVGGVVSTYHGKQPGPLGLEGMGYLGHTAQGLRVAQVGAGLS